MLLWVNDLAWAYSENMQFTVSSDILCVNQKRKKVSIYRRLCIETRSFYLYHDKNFITLLINPIKYVTLLLMKNRFTTLL